jgi:hypothetical protein
MSVHFNANPESGLTNLLLVFFKASIDQAVEMIADSQDSGVIDGSDEGNGLFRCDGTVSD